MIHRRRAHNLLGLSRHEPTLALDLALRKAKPSPDLEPMLGKSGAWTLQRRLPDGRIATLHSPRDPRAEAARQVQARLAAFLGQEGQGGVCLILGLGLGWPALVAAELLPKATALWIADARADAFLLGLDRLDLTALWSRARVRVRFGPPEPGLLDRLSGCAWGVSVQDGLLEAHPGGRAWAVEWLKAAEGALGHVPAPADTSGLPAWLGLCATTRLRGELA